MLSALSVYAIGVARQCTHLMKLQEIKIMRDKFFVWFIACISPFIIGTSCENLAFTGVVGNPEIEKKYQYIYTDNGDQTQDIQITADSLEAAFLQIADDPLDKTNYIIDLAKIPGVPDEPDAGDESYYIPPVNIIYPGVESVRVSLVNNSTTRRVITLKKTGDGGTKYTADDLGSLFTVSEASFSIDGWIFLNGVNSQDDGIDNTAPLVAVDSGYLELKGRARIEENTNTGTGDGAKGGGVYLYLSTLDMDGDASIVMNTANPAAGTAEGGGIYAETSSLIIKGNADISYNEALGSTERRQGSRFDALGGGLCIADHSILFMSGNATVTNNTAKGVNYIGTPADIGAAGGGIAMSGPEHYSYCTIQLSGNVSVSYNSALGRDCNITDSQTGVNTSAAGGGIYIREKSNLVLSGSVQIEGNTAQAGNLNSNAYNQYAFAEGGGVSAGLYDNVSITIEDDTGIKDNSAIGGTISLQKDMYDNERAYGRGGGIVTGDRSAFTMTGGEISGNTAKGGKSNSDDYKCGKFIYSAGGGIFINDADTVAIISGGLIGNNIAGAPDLDHYGVGGAIALSCYSNSGDYTQTTSELQLSGNIRIPTQTDDNSDTEDRRNTIASGRMFDSDSGTNPYASNIYLLPFSTDETITLDVFRVRRITV